MTYPPAPPSVSIAIIDDDRNSCSAIEMALRSIECTPRIYSDAQQALTELQANPTEVVITDIHMPKVDGITILKTIKEKLPSVEVIIVTGFADKALAIEALRWGAFSLLEKPVNLAELLEVVKRTVHYRTIRTERDQLAEQVSLLTRQEIARWGIKAFVGESAAIKEVLKNIRLIQRSASTSVLITGESGTGKELVARAIHFGGSRANHPFIPVNCSAIPSELAESTLFGHRKGSFTGAQADHKGCFEQAHKGTIFLDEIGDMPMALQAKLLRVLEDGIVVPVGAAEGRKVDVRVIAATNATLHDKIESGAFRSDLFYRLSAFPIMIPPLREHPGDIPLLARHFIKSLSGEMGFPTPALDETAIETLKQYPFPGNVRELKNLIERALIESGGRTILPRHLHLVPEHAAPASQNESAASMTLPATLREAEIMLVKRALFQAGGNVSAAAKTLGISRARLYRMLSIAELG